MSLIVADRVQETTNTTGTGAYTLGGVVPGFRTFASVASNADTVYYSITDNVNYEVGLGTYASSGGTIARTTVFASSNSNNAVNWGSGTKNIFLTYPADKAVIEDASNNVTIGNNLVVGGTVDGRDIATDGTKLDTVETNADVTDTANVTSAGALMDSEVTNLAQVKAFDSSDYATAAQGTTANNALPKAGGAITGNVTWGDNNKAIFGAGSDLQIYHDGSNSYIRDEGAGNLFIQGSNSIVLEDPTGGNMLYAQDGGPVVLYYNASIRLTTTTGGVNVDGNVALTGTVDGRDVATDGTKLDTVETNADVTDTANVTSAGALMDSEVDADIKTLVLPANTTISAYGKTIVDDANASAARTTLGVAIGSNVQAYSSVLQNTTASFLTADETKLDYITVTQAVSLDQMETDIAALENGMVYKGDWNAGSGSFPGGGSAQTGWFYYVSGAGTVNGISFTVGDNIVATTDNASTSTYASNWSKHDQTDAVQAVVGLTGSVSKSGLLSALNVEDGADVTDTANVTSAGALMDSEVTNLAQVKAFSSSDYATAAQGTTANAALPKAGGTMTGNIAHAGNFTIDAGGDITLDAGGGDLIISDDATIVGTISTGTSDLKIRSRVSDKDLIFQGNDGGSEITALTLDMSAGGNATFSDLIKTGNMSISGQEIDVSSGNLTLDVAGDIILDAQNAEFFLKGGGVTFAKIFTSGSDFYIGSHVQDKDILFRGNDGGSTITALTLDMSDAGTAIFNHDIKLGSDSAILSIGNDADMKLTHDGTNGDFESAGNLTLDVAGDIILDAAGADVGLNNSGTEYGKFNLSGNSLNIHSSISNGDIIFKGVDGGSSVTALTLNMSEAGEATFNSDIRLGDGKVARFGTDQDFRIGFDGSNATLQNVTSDSDILFKGKDGSSTITALTLDMSNAGRATFNENIIVTGTVDGRDVATDGTKLDGIASGATNVTNNNQLTNGAGYTTNVGDITGVTAGSGISGGGTSGTVTVSHADTSSQASLTALTGAAVVSDIDLDTYGHVTNLATRNITLANLGYTGATNANNITNNNQLTNGAGYTTNTGDITGVTAGTNLNGGGSSGGVTLNLDSTITVTTVNAGTVNTTSDERAKDDITPITGALDKVQQLGGYSFTLKATDEKSSGVIAQEVQKVMPELVQEGAEGLLSVQYGNMVGLLIEAIKEQQAQIDELKQKLNG